MERKQIEERNTTIERKKRSKNWGNARRKKVKQKEERNITE